MASDNNPDSHDLRHIVARYCKERALRPESVNTYTSIVKRFVRETGLSSVSSIETHHMFKWKDDVAGRSSMATYNNYHRHLKALFRYCVRNGMISKSPLEDVPQFTRANQRREPCKAEDVFKILDYLESLDPLRTRYIDSFRLWQAMIRTLYYTGMRRSQICGLRWSDIDFEQCTILLRKEHSKNSRQWMIPLDERLAPHILALKERTMALLGAAFCEQDQVFRIQLFNPRYAGDRLSPPQVSGILKHLSRKTGTSVTPHSIRHLFATTLANPDPNSRGGIGHTDVPDRAQGVPGTYGHYDYNPVYPTEYQFPEDDAQRTQKCISA